MPAWCWDRLGGSQEDKVLVWPRRACEETHTLIERAIGRAGCGPELGSRTLDGPWGWEVTGVGV